MNSRLTFALLIVLIVLAGVAYATSRPGVGAANATATPNMAVFSFQPSDVKSLKIETGGKSITVERSGDNAWKLSDPPAQYSDSTHIAGVVATLTGLQKDRELDKGSNPLSAFGLDKPYLRATATLNDGSQHTLIAGNKNPGGSGYYAQVEGQPGLFIVPLVGVDSLAQLVAQPPIATPTPPATPLATPPPSGSPTATPNATTIQLGSSVKLGSSVG